MAGVTFYGDVEVKGYVRASNGKALGVVTAMPTAAKNVSGCAVLFTGTSDAYVTGAVYECVSSGSGYAWNRVDAVTAVDGSLDSASTNPVQNKVVKAALDGKASTAAATSSAAGLMSAADKAKLDAVSESADAVSVTQVKTSGTEIARITVNGTATSIYQQDGDTKNTAGATDSSAKLFLVGATEQTANPQTYTQDTAYVGTDGKLYSGGKVVIASGDTAAGANADGDGAVISSTYAKKADLADVATSGKYSDLSGTPAIPSVGNATITIQKNGSAVGSFTTNQSSAGTIDITVPTATSGLTNDSGFITKAVSDLTNYYTKSNTYSKTEVDALVAAKLTISVVTALPTTGISTSTIYLVKASTTGTNNAYDEYVYTGTAWEKIGTTETDLSQYAKASSLAAVATSGSYNDLSDKPAIPTVPTAVSAFTNDKGYLTAHPGITMGTDTTSAASPAHGGSFTVVDSITKDTNGHVTKVNTKTVTLPSDSNTDTKMTQAYSTTAAEFPLLMTAASGVSSTSSRGDTTAVVNNQIHANPSTGKITATGFVGPLTGDVTGNVSGNAGGNAATATKLASAKSLKVNLATTDAASFDGSADATGIGVSGTLPVANGGTGATSLSSITVGAATKATQDGSGNVITSTYMPVAGGTMGGSLLVNGDITIKNGCTLKFGTSGDGISQVSSPSYLIALTGSAASAGVGWTSVSGLLSGYATTATVNAAKPIALASVAVTWASDSTYSDYPYKGTMTVSGCTANHVPSVTFSVADATSGDYAPCSESGANVVYIWSKKNTLTTVPAVVCIPKSS